MSLFHKHRLKLVAKTWAPPVRGDLSIDAAPHGVMDRAMHGCQTLVWKCEDESCDKIVKVEMLGQPVPVSP